MKKVAINFNLTIISHMNIQKMIKKLRLTHTPQELANKLKVSLRQFQYYQSGSCEPPYSVGKKIERMYEEVKK